MKEQELKKDNILPVYMVSTENYISQFKCRLYYTRGKSVSYETLSGGCVFVDHPSVFMSIKNQAQSEYKCS